MKLIYVFAFLFFGTSSVLAQAKATIEYGVVYDLSQVSEEVRLAYPDYYEMQKEQKTRESELTFLLDIDRQRSLFYHPEIDENDQTLWLLFIDAGGKQVFYTDVKKDQVISQFEYWNKKIEIESSIDENPWEFTDEKKKIQDYVCYKAVKKSANSVDGKGKNEVEAWFTEDIPLHFGPRGYSGLPGLILELTENYMTYYVKKIDFSNDTQVVYPKFKGQKMTREQFLEAAPSIRQKSKRMITNSRG